MRYFVLILGVLMSALTVAQQLNEYGKPNRFIPFGISQEINSSYHEINPVFTPDERILYFSRVDHPDNHYGNYRSQDIWYSELQDDGSWSSAQRVDAFFNNSRYNTIYSITENGEFLVSGIYTKKGRYKKRGLSLVTKTENGWSIATKMKVPKISRSDDGLTSSMYLNDKGNTLLLAYSTSWLKPSTRKIRYSIKKPNSKWKKPKAIKNKQLAKKFHSIESPYLSDDGLTIYFSAYRRGGWDYYKNDIYKISRKDSLSSSWDNPVKLSNTVNTEDWENYYKHFENDVWAVFNKAAVGDDSDILVVKLYEPKPYVDLEGKVVLDGNPFTGKFEVMINSQVVDSVRINQDSSTYAVQLPLGGRYEIQAKAEEMEAKVEIIDAVGELEYLPMNRDLELSLLPFLDLSGKVTVYDEPLTVPFNVLVNGYIIDSLITNSINGTYSVRLPLGRRYELEVRSGNYIPEKVVVDVTDEKRQIRIDQALKVTTIPYVDISGRVINTETNAPILQSANPKVMVNGIVIDSISTSLGEYKVRLKWGQKYVLQIQADEFGPIVAVVDLINVKNYQEINQNLYANPLKKYATVTGKVLNMKNGLPVNGNYFIEVNGARSTNSTVNTSLGTYEVKVNLGEKTTLTANADKFFPISEVIDLTAETENVKVLKDLQMMPLEVGEKILLNHIAFETASTNLKKESFADIDRVVDLLRAVPTLKIEISGHTDSSGKDAYNLSLSNSRAKSVSDYILSQGIATDRVEYKGYGEANPVANNLTPEGRAKNRRVEFVVLEQ